MTSVIKSTALPRHKARDNQRFLFTHDVLLSGKGACRSWTGDFFEEATAQLTNSKRYVTDSRCQVCPDMHFYESVFFESKSIGNNGSFIVYHRRLLKDLAFCGSGWDKKALLYWLWRHEAEVHKNDSIQELRSNLALSVRKVAVVTVDEISDSVANKECRLVNNDKTLDGKRLGYGNQAKVYGMGWTIPFNYMLKLCNHSFSHSQLMVYGYTIPTVHVYISQAAAKIAPSLNSTW